MGYSDELCDEFKKWTNTKIEHLRALLDNIQLWKALHHFEDGAVFDRSFMEYDFEKYASFRKSTRVVNNTESLDSIPYCHSRMTDTPEEDAKYIHAEYVESRLKQIPFELAVSYAIPEYRNKSKQDILQGIFKCPIEWVFNPGSILYMDSAERERVLKQFEYMCYYVINIRDELEFDIRESLS